ncbi:MAG: PASTA domain-containing protein [Candidatus Helarchaeota archaeon]|nr:PASTA domain-containing protein [Candidatus Helarchaeota archaeon]
MSESPSITPEEELLFLEEELPFEDFILQIAKGVAEAQKLLDRQSLALQETILKDDDLRSAGVQATWYHIPEVTANLKISITAHSEIEETTKESRLILFLCPYNATYKNTYNFDYQGTSEVSFKIVPVPPPVAATTTIIVPNLIGKSQDEAERALNEAGLALGTVSEEKSDEQPGNVIKQDPEANTSTFLGNSVNIVISTES